MIVTIPATDQIRVPGTVWYIINDNFALVETDDTKSLALFDTYDFYVTQKGTAAEAKQSLKQARAKCSPLVFDPTFHIKVIGGDFESDSYLLS